MPFLTCYFLFVKTDSGDLPASYPSGTVDYFLGG